MCAALAQQWPNSHNVTRAESVEVQQAAVDVCSDGVACNFDHMRNTAAGRRYYHIQYNGCPY
jgi:hypothetical protein